MPTPNPSRIRDPTAFVVPPGPYAAYPGTRHYVCERALKKAILHRKNALFYKTLNGAYVGDIFMSLMHTAELNGADAFDYLVALQRHHDDVASTPADWMPWNYKDALARLAHGPAPPA